MSRRSIVVWLRRWIEKIRLALWLNEREFDASRRAVLFGCAAVVASTVLVHVPFEGRVVGRWVDYGELAQVTRQAFLPRLRVQIYKASPLMTALVAGRGLSAS